MDNLTPGVRVTEVASTDIPIAGVGTSTAAFIGCFSQGMADSPNPAPASGMKAVLRGYVGVVRPLADFHADFPAEVLPKGKKFTVNFGNHPMSMRAADGFQNVKFLIQFKAKISNVSNAENGKLTDIKKKYGFPYNFEKFLEVFSDPAVVVRTFTIQSNLFEKLNEIPKINVQYLLRPSKNINAEYELSPRERDCVYNLFDVRQGIPHALANLIVLSRALATGEHMALKNNLKDVPGEAERLLNNLPQAANVLPAATIRAILATVLRWARVSGPQGLSDKNSLAGLEEAEASDQSAKSDFSSYLKNLPSKGAGNSLHKIFSALAVIKDAGRAICTISTGVKIGILNDANKILGAIWKIAAQPLELQLTVGSVSLSSGDLSLESANGQVALRVTKQPLPHDGDTNLKMRMTAPEGATIVYTKVKGADGNTRRFNLSAAPVDPRSGKSFIVVANGADIEIGYNTEDFNVGGVNYKFSIEYSFADKHTVLQFENPPNTNANIWACFVALSPNDLRQREVEAANAKLSFSGSKETCDLSFIDLDSRQLHTSNSCFVEVTGGLEPSAVTKEWVDGTAKQKLSLAFPDVDVPAGAKLIVSDAVAGIAGGRTDHHLRDSATDYDGVPVLCTSYADYARIFAGVRATGDGKDYRAQINLANAVAGFFVNGGTQCWVVKVRNSADISVPGWFDRLEAKGDISIIAAPGFDLADEDEYNNSYINVIKAVKDFCKLSASAVALVDPKPSPIDSSKTGDIIKDLFVSDYAAYYYPWLKVTNLAPKAASPYMYVPPSGHIAGVYARVDTLRGVHKAPANEVVQGVLGLAVEISGSQQSNLNGAGINCIRALNGNILVWGARLLGGEALQGNGQEKYVNVRRLLIFLRKSIERGTQWAVFEPNDRPLWQKLKRSISAFLTRVWRDGALFGKTPAEAFYVLCDETNNTADDRANGVLNIQIGVAAVRPAEFVLIQISQWSGPAPS